MQPVAEQDTVAPATTRGARVRGQVARILPYLDPETPRRFTRLGWWIVAALVALALAPALVAPFGNDEAIFYVSAQKILQGAVHYRDIIDIKPPLIYHLYAGAIALFGDYALSIRLLDLLLQAGTAAILCLIVRRFSGSDLRGATVAVMYALQYFAQSPGIGALPESYVGLLGVPMIWIALASRRSGRWMLAGMLVGTAFLLKFTLGAMLSIPILIDLMMRWRPRSGIVARWGLLVAGFVAVAGLLPVYLFTTGSVADFLGMQQFTRGYSQLQWSSTMAGITNLLSALPVGAVDYYTLLLMAATVGGGLMAIRGSEDPGALAHRSVDLLRASLIACVVLLGTAILEGKYAPFHVARLYPFGLILATPALLRLLRATLTTQLDRFALVMLPIAVIAMLLYSPLPRYAIHALRTYAFVRGGEEGFDSATNPHAEATSFVEMRRIGDYVVANRRDGDLFFAATSSPGLVYRYARTVPPYPVLHAAFVKAPFAPAKWRGDLRTALLRDRPRFIAAQTADRAPDIAGTEMTSLEMLRSLPGVAGMLDTGYVQVFKGTWYVMLERRGGRAR